MFPMLNNRGCIKFPIRSVGEEYQVVKRREYHGVGKNTPWKNENGFKQYYLPDNIEAVGKNIK